MTRSLNIHINDLVVQMYYFMEKMHAIKTFSFFMLVLTMSNWLTFFSDTPHNTGPVMLTSSH